MKLTLNFSYLKKVENTMSCLWCEGDKNEIQKFLKILSKEIVTNDNEAYLYCAEKCIPDLFFCLECVKVYHDCKHKFIKKEESKKELVACIEHERLIDNMQKIKEKISLNGNSTDITYLTPFVEILTYPYLCLNYNVWQHFISGLEWMIDFMEESIMEQECFYKTWFFLTLCSNSKIKEWATNCIGNMKLIDNENFNKFRPIFNCILNILFEDDSVDFQMAYDIETEIKDNTKLARHIYMGKTSGEIWIACGVIFNSLESRVLKILLTSNNNDKILLLLFKSFHDSSINIWVFLYILEILLGKLGCSFWLLSGINGNTPIQLYNAIINHKDFLILHKKYQDTAYVEQELTYSSYSHMVFSHTKNVNEKDSCNCVLQLFSWTLPFLKSVMNIGIEAQTLFGYILFYHTDFLDKCKVSDLLYHLAYKNIVEIFSFTLNMNFFWILLPFIDGLPDLLLKLTINDFTGVISFTKQIASLVNMLVAKALGKKYISKELSLSFQSNFKKMLMHQSYDLNVLKNILLIILQNSTKIKPEPLTENNDLDFSVSEAFNEEQIIKIDDDYDDKTGILELDTECLSITKSSPIDMRRLGSHSPILISDEEEVDLDTHAINNFNSLASVPIVYSYNTMASGIKFEDLKNKTIKPDESFLSIKYKEVTPSVPQSNVPKIFEASKFSLSESNQRISNIGLVPKSNDSTLLNIIDLEDSESLKINQSIKHKNSNFKANENLDKDLNKNKILVSQTENNVLANFETEKDMSNFVDKCFDISSNFNEPLLVKKIAPKASGSTLMQRSNTLRREKIEQELTTKSKPLKLPNLNSKVLSTSSFHKLIFKWKVEWFENQKEPVETTKCLKNVGINFDTYDEYYNTFCNLILCEAQSLVSKEWKEKLYSSKIYKITEINEHKTIDTSYHIKCEYECKENYLDCPSEDDLVLVHFINENQSVFGIVEKAVINKRYKNSFVPTYVLNIKLAEMSNSKTYKIVSIKKIASLRTVIRQFNALTVFKNSLLAADILKPFRMKTYNCNEELLQKDKFKRLSKLNLMQLQALSTVSRAVCQVDFVIPRIVLLQGPPGTGKSYTIKTIITHLMQEFYKSRASSNQKSQRILFCAPSNAAVDEIVRRLVQSPPYRDDNDSHAIKHGNCGDFNIVRVGQKTQVSSDLVQYSLEYLLERELKNYKSSHNKSKIIEQIKLLKSRLQVMDIECQKLRMSNNQNESEQYMVKTEERSRMQKSLDELNYKRNSLSEKGDDQGLYSEEEHNLQRSLLLRADIICSTLSGAGSKPMVDAFRRSREIPFRCVIIDEAGQCTEPDALIPLQYGSSKLVLVGDPAQLPATVISQRAGRFNLGQSLFERLYKGIIINSEAGVRPAILLNYQYRMAPEICWFPNKRFYNNELKSNEALIKKKSDLKPYVFLNLDESREDKTRMGGIHNPVEREHIIAICEKIVTEKNANVNEIAVITPYRYQASLIKQELNKKLAQLEGIEVDTIDGFQGREKRIVIFSCVRASNHQESIGFLSNPQRMNVALTRAKDVLIILANCNSIEIDEDWKALVDDAKSRGLLFTVQNCNDTLQCIFNTSDVAFKQTDHLEENKTKNVTHNQSIAKNFIDTSIISSDNPCFPNYLDNLQVYNIPDISVKPQSDLEKTVMVKESLEKNRKTQCNFNSELCTSNVLNTLVMDKSAINEPAVSMSLICNSVLNEPVINENIKKSQSCYNAERHILNFLHTPLPDKITINEPAVNVPLLNELAPKMSLMDRPENNETYAVNMSAICKSVIDEPAINDCSKKSQCCYNAELHTLNSLSTHVLDKFAISEPLVNLSLNKKPAINKLEDNVSVMDEPANNENSLNEVAFNISTMHLKVNEPEMGKPLNNESTLNKLAFKEPNQNGVFIFEKDFKMDLLEGNSDAELNKLAAKISHNNNNISEHISTNVQLRKTQSTTGNSKNDKKQQLDKNTILVYKNELISSELKRKFESIKLKKNHQKHISSLNAQVENVKNSYDNIDNQEPYVRKVTEDVPIIESDKPNLIKKQQEKKKKYKNANTKNQENIDNADIQEPYIRKVTDDVPIIESNKSKKKQKKRKKYKNSDTGIQESIKKSTEYSPDIIIKKILKEQLKEDFAIQEKIIGAVIETLGDKLVNKIVSKSKSVIDIESPTYSNESNSPLETDSNVNITEKSKQCALQLRINSSNSKESDVQQNVVDTSDGAQSFRRNKPSESYYNLPHHHSDGAYCIDVCKRVLEREKKRRFFAEDDLLRKNSSLPKLIEWKLIPLEIETPVVYSKPELSSSYNLVSDPRLRSNNSSVVLGHLNLTKNDNTQNDLGTLRKDTGFSILSQNSEHFQQLECAVELPKLPVLSEADFFPHDAIDDHHSTPMDICEDIKSPILINEPISKYPLIPNRGLTQSEGFFSSSSKFLGFNDNFLCQPRLDFQNQEFLCDLTKEPTGSKPFPSKPPLLFKGSFDNYTSITKFQDGIQSKCFDDPCLLSWRAVEKIKENKYFNDIHETQQVLLTTSKRKVAYISPQPIENHQSKRTNIQSDIGIQNYEKQDIDSVININEIMNATLQDLAVKNVFEDCVRQISLSNNYENKEYMVNYVKGFLIRTFSNSIKSDSASESTNVQSPIQDLSSEPVKMYNFNELHEFPEENKLYSNTNCKYEQPKDKKFKITPSDLNLSENIIPSFVHNQKVLIQSPTFNEPIPLICDESKVLHQAQSKLPNSITIQINNEAIQTKNDTIQSNDDAIQRRIQRFGVVQKEENCVTSPSKKRFKCSLISEHEKTSINITDNLSKTKFSNSTFECRVLIEDIKDNDIDFTSKKESLSNNDKQLSYARKVKRAKMPRSSNPKAVIKINSRQLKSSNKNYLENLSPKKIKMSVKSDDPKSVDTKKNCIQNYNDNNDVSIVRSENLFSLSASSNDKKTDVFSRLGSRLSTDNLSEISATNKPVYKPNEVRSFPLNYRQDSTHFDNTCNRKQFLIDHRSLGVVKPYRYESPGSETFQKGYSEKKSFIKKNFNEKTLPHLSPDKRKYRLNESSYFEGTSYDERPYSNHATDYFPNMEVRRHYKVTQNKKTYRLRP
ncbi:uncharacterized protein LOC100204258 isoform X2 [Hydra vulgaris]|uniref:uncharacterized protein LOC100204258 isoform X2 n=2 Tax=Hydra vulgaris TaxID=6087 RepID=UPI0032E9FF92